MAISIQRSVLVEAIQKHNPSTTAVVNHDSGSVFSYGQLLRDTAYAKERLLQTAGRDDIGGERVAFLVENGYQYVGM
jgi:malonyl-CoA/methylmalonyl-CoA synthetase